MGIFRYLPLWMWLKVVFSACHISVATVSRDLRALSGRRQGSRDGTGRLGRVRELTQHHVAIGRAFVLDAHHVEQRVAGGVLVERGVLDEQLHLDVEDACGVLGPLDVSPDPEQRLGDAAQHAATGPTLES